MAIRLRRPQSAADWRAARRLVEDYAASLNVDLSFQNFADELEHLAHEYAPPTGAFLIAEEQEMLGCVGLRRFAVDVGEVKRLYIVPAARGRGIGRTLAEGIVAAGR